jgi:hypothetical protein
MPLVWFRQRFVIRVRLVVAEPWSFDVSFDWAEGVTQGHTAASDLANRGKPWWKFWQSGLQSVDYDFTAERKNSTNARTRADR